MGILRQQLNQATSQSESFIEPSCPDFTPLETIHRGHSWHVPIYVTTNGNFRPAFALPAWNLKEDAEHMTALLETDAYAAINGFWTDSSYRNTSVFKANGKELLKPMRRKQHLHYINAVFIDIDCHNKGITPGQAIGSLIDAQDAKLVPQISIITKSGRGVWAFWLLADGRPEHSHLGVRATRVAIPWAEAIQRELQSRFAHLGADAQSTDLCRVTRIPGSINSKSESRVEYWIRKDSDGKVASYTLEQFGAFMGIDKPTFARPTGKLLANGLDPKVIGRLRWEQDLERMTQLFKYRGIIQEGHRGAAVFLYALFLKRCGFRGSELRNKAERIWPHLEQLTDKARAYTRQQFRGQLCTSSDANPSHRQIASLLGVTSEEAALTGWPIADAEQPLSRSCKQTMRRMIVAKLMDSRDQLSVREAIALVTSTDGRLKCSTKTMAADLKAVCSPE